MERKSSLSTVFIHRIDRLKKSRSKFFKTDFLCCICLLIGNIEILYRRLHLFCSRQAKACIYVLATPSLKKCMIPLNPKRKKLNKFAHVENLLMKHLCTCIKGVFADVVLRSV